MPGVSIEYLVDSTDLTRAMMRAKSAISGPKMALFLSEGAHETLLSRLEDRFNQEGDDASGKWAPLGAVSQRIRSDQGFDEFHPINRRTGELFRFLDEDIPDIFLTPGGATSVWPGGTPVDPVTQEKFQTAQRGKVNPRTVPRPVLAISPVDSVEITEKLGAFVAAFMSGLRS